MSKPIQKITVAISDDFLKSFSAIPKKQQSKVREFVEKFRVNPASPAINYEKIQMAKDQNLRSVRIDQDYRGIVLKPASGNVYMLLWVDHHDDAYAWASNRVYSVHADTGSLQVVKVEQQTALQTADGPQKSEHAEQMLFDAFGDVELLQLGVPVLLLPLVRRIGNQTALDALESQLPQEAFEALFFLAEGFSLEEVLKETLKEQPPAKVDTADFVTALEKPDSKRRFHVVEGALELAEILNSPLELWRIFLHPSQRSIVEKDFNGPVRVLGGAGTGKTVVAMHRAKWLAEKVFMGESERILFTTFTKNLAADIQGNLRKLCPADVMKRIDVVNLDAWVIQFLKKHGYHYGLIFQGETGSYWQNALNLAPAGLNIDESFYLQEWTQVIQAQGIKTVDEYLKASRVGRQKKLTRPMKQAIWTVFEEYRAQLNAKGLKEITDAVRDARIILQNKGDILPYRTILVDEAQDIGPEAFKFIRQMIPESRGELKNDLFIVGDAHQRIYRNRVVLSRCGINIKGRSKKLKINYRTTEETRKWAVRLLEGKAVDDLDGELDSQKGYKSLLHGDSPEARCFHSFAEEVQFIDGYLKQLAKAGIDVNTVCLVARTNGLLKQYEAALQEKGLKTYLIKRSVAEDRGAPGLRLATMHRVKGLEFDEVIIASVNEGVVPLQLPSMNDQSASQAEENESLERALLYVSATRAKKKVLMTSCGVKSRFL
ncbi:MAG: UvrD-helicase domain-containing protein [Syntrophobacterales bacterium]|nr:UvrD-helicase domain-containing protein [Syntrophobacterales bacterium]